jgi:RNA polymerase sigma factor (sigma-70 family)
MTTTPMNRVTQHLLAACGREGMTDGELLNRFLSHRDDVALAALVRRHGPMVWGVCRRLLRSHHDAEDAFQATFLVLVKKAATLPNRETVGNWLYGVAHQTAVRMRAMVARRGVREKQVEVMPEPTTAEQYVWDDLAPVVDEELSRLPDKYRVLIVLCDLEGVTRKEVARRLDIPEGTAASRLAAARAMLAKRLARRGIVLSGVLLGAVLSQQSASASVPALVVSKAIKVASLVAAGQAATGVISVKVAALTEGVLKVMFLSKLKGVLAVVLVVGLILAGAAGLHFQTQAADQPKAKGEQPVAEKNQQKGEEKQPMPKQEPGPKNAKTEPKVLTPEQAIKQNQEIEQAIKKSQEKVTVKFKVTAAETRLISKSNVVGEIGEISHEIMILREGDFAVQIVPPAVDTIKRLGIEAEKHFKGKVVQVTGPLQPGQPFFGTGKFQIVVNDLTQLKVVGK